MTEPLDQEIRTLRSIFWSSRDPEGRAFVPLADAYRRAGEYRQAMELLTDGLDRHPDFASAHVVAARLYLESGLVQEAELASRRVLELDGENVMGLRCLASSLRAQGRDDAAAELSAQIRELEGEDGTAVVASAAPVPHMDPEDAVAVVVPDEPVVDIADLAPDEALVGAPAGDGVDMAAPAPAEDVQDALAAVTPHEDVEDAVAAVVPDEPVVELDALAPTEVDAAEHVQREVAADDEEDEDAAPLVTRTLAELYARQGEVARALDVYRRILEAVPGDEDILRRIAELESGVEEAVATDEPVAEAIEPSADAVPAGTLRAGEAEAGREDTEEAAGALDEDDVPEHPWDAEAQQELHEVDTPFAWTEEDAEERPEGPPISTYFTRLLSWTPAESAEGGAPGAGETAGEGRGHDDDDGFATWLNQDGS